MPATSCPACGKCRRNVCELHMKDRMGATAANVKCAMRATRSSIYPSTDMGGGRFQQNLALLGGNPPPTPTEATGGGVETQGRSTLGRV